jgi:hypothetical protein
MQKRQIIKAAFCFICSGSLLFSCATLRSPRGWLPDVQKLQSQAYGCWIMVDSLSDGLAMSISGELIAATSDSLFVLKENGISEIPLSVIREANLEIFKEKRVAGMWATLGTLSTLSHGFWLIASGPVWIIAGISSAVGESRAGLVQFEGPPPRDIRKYARFPQGLPEGIDVRKLKMKIPALK